MYLSVFVIVESLCMHECSGIIVVHVWVNWVYEGAWTSLLWNSSRLLKEWLKTGFVHSYTTPCWNFFFHFREINGNSLQSHLRPPGGSSCSGFIGLSFTGASGGKHWKFIDVVISKGWALFVAVWKVYDPPLGRIDFVILEILGRQRWNVNLPSIKIECQKGNLKGYLNDWLFGQLTMTRLTVWLTDKDPAKSECRFTFSARWLHARHGHARYGSADGAHGAHGWHGPHGTHGHAAQLSKLCHGWLRSWKPQFWYGQRLIQNQ